MIQWLKDVNIFHAMNTPFDYRLLQGTKNGFVTESPQPDNAPMKAH